MLEKGEVPLWQLSKEELLPCHPNLRYFTSETSWVNKNTDQEGNSKTIVVDQYSSSMASSLMAEWALPFSVTLS